MTDRQPSVQKRVIQDYFHTTSSAGHEGPLDYARATEGLRRGLGDWLDVKGKDVWDLGSGTGELCWLAAYAGARSVVGVNLCESEIAYARQHVQARFEFRDVVSFVKEAADSSVDRIFALNLLEHLSKDELVQVLENALRCLRPGGTLIALVPNATSPFGGMTRYWDITHQLAFTPSSVRQVARLCGFHRAHFREWGPRPHGVISGGRYLAWQLYRRLIWLRLMVETASGKGGIYTADMQFRLLKRPSE